MNFPVKLELSEPAFRTMVMCLRKAPLPREVTDGLVAEIDAQIAAQQAMELEAAQEKPDGD